MNNSKNALNITLYIALKYILIYDYNITYRLSVIKTLV